ncbi:lactate utilization protein B [Acidobacteriota bacterium]
MKFKTNDFPRYARAAALNPEVRKVFTSATDRLIASREKALNELGGIEPLRKAGQNIRRNGLEDLQGWLFKLEDSVTQAGGHVHHAMTAEDACKIIYNVLTKRGITRVVKSKSMTTLEIGLNDWLEQKGMNPLETDLGEYIIQLAGSPPSHIVGPAFHMTRSGVAQLFRKHHKESISDEPEKLAMAARIRLRQAFLEAEAGITGVNFAASDTGTLVIVENEGNARMVSSLPKVHIAIMGIDKVVPSIESVPTLLRLLVCSATGQRMPSYVSFITGNGTKGEKKESDRELHLVLVDNGRSRILADPDFREVLMCIRCGACLNICPVYSVIGGHPYGFAYQGPIGAVLAPLILGSRAAPSHPFASTLCGACREVCPVGIELPRMLVEHRSRMNDTRKKRRSPTGTRSERTMIRTAAWALDGTHQRRWFSKSASRLLAMMSWGKRIKHLPYPFSRWTRFKDFPKPPRESFSVWWSKRLHRE